MVTNVLAGGRHQVTPLAAHHPPSFRVLRATPAEHSVGVDIDEDALEIAAAALAAAGFRRCERELPIPQAGPRSFFPAVAPRVRRAILTTLGMDPDSADGEGRLDAADLEPYTRSFLQHAGRVSEESHRRALASLAEWEHLWRSALGPETVILSPTTSRRPPALGVLTGQHSIEESARALAEPTAFTWLANALGWHASALPVHGNGRLPSSVQIMGAPQTIETLLRASAAVEDASRSAPGGSRQDPSYE